MTRSCYFTTGPTRRIVPPARQFVPLHFRSLDLVLSAKHAIPLGSPHADSGETVENEFDLTSLARADQIIE
jgi:hypothetical protein